MGSQDNDPSSVTSMIQISLYAYCSNSWFSCACLKCVCQFSSRPNSFIRSSLLAFLDYLAYRCVVICGRWLILFDENHFILFTPAVESSVIFSIHSMSCTFFLVFKLRQDIAHINTYHICFKVLILCYSYREVIDMTVFFTCQSENFFIPMHRSGSPSSFIFSISHQ